MNRRRLATVLSKLLLFVSSASFSWAVELSDVEEIQELQALFNKDEGAVRIILLMSPT
jgi:hypothetical protein